jgi:hypothetical protein
MTPRGGVTKSVFEKIVDLRRDGVTAVRFVARVAECPLVVTPRT